MEEEEIVIGNDKSSLEAVELTHASIKSLELGDNETSGATKLVLPPPTDCIVERSQNSEFLLKSGVPSECTHASIKSLELGDNETSGATKLVLPSPTNCIVERSQSSEFLLKSGVPSECSHDKDIKEVHVMDGECPCHRCPHHHHLHIEGGKVENKETLTKEEKVKKKRSSWMPDPENRWPIQGFQ
ncbi:hypothetical protein ZOSMA_97G00420 [Zostera marina]|uniref:Uncharacterized protein n=1 Tax=Zostera marina TaxID=29655 RepID=A0A0K9NJY0_ZOSMR|nr:hypothetical protein ZOSMA_97G00420 [Zostera marina]